MQEYNFTSGKKNQTKTKKNLLKNEQMKQERRLNIHEEQTIRDFERVTFTMK